MKTGNEIKIINRCADVEKFKPAMIRESLLEETSLSEKEVENVVIRVKNQIYALNKDEIFTSEVREIIKSSLLKNEGAEIAEEYDTISIAKTSIDSILNERVDLNANQNFNVDTINKNIVDEVLTEYTFKHILTEAERDMHLKGFVHLHDLSSFPVKVNCWSFSPVPFFEKGFKIAGDHGFGTTAGSPRHLSTAINMIREMFTIAGTEQFAGALGIPLFNVWLAPFVRGLSIPEIKQALQSFIFDMNQSLRRMGEITFSNINIEFGIPKFLENEPAIGPEGKVVGVLKDFEFETQLIADILMDILYAGDFDGTPFLFPNTAFSMRNEFKNEPRYNELLDKSFKLHSKFPMYYWINQDLEENGGHSISFGCRSQLNTNWTGDWKYDTMFTGNSSFVTLNLPRLGVLNNDVDDIISDLEGYMDLSMDVMEKRTNIYKGNKDKGMYPFTSQLDIHGNPVYDINNTTHTFGVIGIEQMLKNIGIEDGILSEDGQNDAEKVLEFINERKNFYTDVTGLRTSVIASPAEYACKRLAEIDIKEFGNDINYGGTKKNPYYHNSYHVLDQDIDILEKSKIESKFAKHCAGGSILHTWLGSYPNKEALKELVSLQKDLGSYYITTTNSFTSCNSCNNNSNGINDVCPSCNSDNTISFDKITGYISPVSNFNKSKQQEVKDRYRYDL